MVISGREKTYIRAMCLNNHDVPEEMKVSSLDDYKYTHMAITGER